MSGLGIVLEEAESPSPGRAHLSAPVPQSPSIAANTNYTESEALLPPLPDESAAPVARTASTSPLVGPLKTHTLITGSPAPSGDYEVEALPFQLTHDETDRLRQQPPPKVLSDLFSDHLFALYELDSLALHSDSTPITFPAVDLHASATPTSVHQHQPPSLTSGSGGLNTSPLKRLKSLKNGIRKLSLLKMGSLSLVSSPVVADLPTPPPRPILSPLQTEQPCLDLSLQSSAGDSLRSSTFSSLAAPSNGGAAGGTSGSTPVAASHVHTASQGLIAKARRRTLSSSHCTLAASTPPLPLPIITLSENLNTTKENMVDIEQTFFEIVVGTGTTSDANNLSQLTTSDELIEYSLYLNQHKKSVVGAYDATRDRLISSGWCSNHDLENLSLQRDSSLSQIDTKLLQIEEKLNLEFQLLMLNNPTLHMHPHGKGFAATTPLREVSLSPSLKVLESRCFAFSGSDGH